MGEKRLKIAGLHESVTAEVLGRAEIEERGMGGLAAVAKGSAQDPRLISLRYAGGGEAEGLP